MSSQRESVPFFETALVKTAFPGLSNCRQIDIAASEWSRLVFITDPAGLAAERYKLLRRQICASNPSGGAVMLTSPAPADGKTLTSINLAFCLAEGGCRTCLVDLDFRSPGIFRTLEYELEAPDLIDVQEGKASLNEAIHQVRGRSLHLLGIRPRRPSLQFDFAAFRSLLLRLRSGFSWVILDLAPAVPFSDVSEILPDVDGALLVVRAGKTRKSVVGPSLDILGSKLWGVVLNDAEVSGGDYYGYYNYGRRFERARKAAPDEYQSIRGISLRP